MSTAAVPPISVVEVTESSVRDFWVLLKPGVLSLVVFTGLVGLYMAPGDIHPLIATVAVLCIAMGSGAGGAINMWYDRDIDAIMNRTSSRPVPAGRIAPADALGFGIILAIVSVSVMGVVVGWVAASILAFAIFFYAVIYTMWLKRTTSQNIVIGGAAGAFPPMIGWAAVTGDVSWVSLSLFLIIFLWTPPHFWALALYRNSDYQKANVPMMPVVKGLAETKKQIVFYSYLLVVSSFLPVYLQATGLLYGVSAAVLGYLFVKLARDVMRSNEEAPARKLFGFSIVYLFALFAVMSLDHGIMHIIKQL
jgi:protoheme IX farnesyltransferase